MSQRNKIQRLLRKGALATCLSLSVVCSSLSAVTAYAGPADDPAAAAPVIGPGGPGTTTDNAAAGTDTNANAGQQADNSYYNQTLSNPVVNPVDKYSYSQMVNDISALASCYPGTVTVKSIGKSADGYLRCDCRQSERIQEDFVPGSDSCQRVYRCTADDAAARVSGSWIYE